MINTSILDAIILDNNYTAQDIKNDFENHPEGWNSILKYELSWDVMSEEQREEFQEQLFDYANNNA